MNTFGPWEGNITERGNIHAKWLVGGKVRRLGRRNTKTEMKGRGEKQC